jgi:hypothetical protein
MGQNEALQGTCWGTHWELDDHVGDPLGTYWKQKNSNNSKLQKIFTKKNIVVNALEIEPFHSGLSFGLPNNTREGDFFHSKSQDSWHMCEGKLWGLIII